MQVRWAATQAQVHSLESQTRSQQRSLEASSEENASLKARVLELDSACQAARMEAADCREAAAAVRCDLEQQLEASRSQYDRLLSKKTEVGGMLESVGKELLAVKGLLKGVCTETVAADCWFDGRAQGAQEASCCRHSCRPIYSMLTSSVVSLHNRDRERGGKASRQRGCRGGAGDSQSIGTGDGT